MIQRDQPAAPPVPADLDGEARRTWLSLVAGSKPGHFNESDVPLTGAFCHAAAMEAKADRAIMSAAVVAPEAIRLHEHAVRMMHLLAPKLRVAPQSRAPNPHARSSARVPSLSYYERAALMEANGDDAAR